MPTRSVVWVSVVQKQVGQASVQLPHVMQRSATCAQRGMVELGQEPVVEAGGRHGVADAGPDGGDRGRRAVLLRGAGGPQREPLQELPAGRRVGLHQEARASSSVSTRS